MKTNRTVSCNNVQYNFIETDTLIGFKTGLQIYLSKHYNTITDYIIDNRDVLEFNSKHGYILRYVYKGRNDVYISSFFKLGEKYLKF